MNYLSQTTPEEFHGKKVLVRLDLNVPIDESGTILDSDMDRIKKSMATLEFLMNAGARIIAISHIGRDAHESLRPVVQKMQEFITLGFSPKLFSDETNDMVNALGNGHVLLLENLRSDVREEQNDIVFAQLLADYAEYYVNDAFAVSHRSHASLVGVPKLLPSYIGFQFEQEIQQLSQSFTPAHPSILVLGGAKFETKLPVIEKFLPLVDHIIIGGALANNFYQAMGYEIGASLVDQTATITHLVNHPKILIPTQVIIESEQGVVSKEISDVTTGEKIVDIAPLGLEKFTELFTDAKFILWNGPMGNYENHFVTGSEKIIHLISESSAQSIVGGGDSVALIEQLGLADRFNFISTGGGAMLEYLVNGSLPAIDALEK